MLKKLDPLVYLIAVLLFGCDGRPPNVPGSDSESAGSLIDSTLVTMALEYKELGRDHFMAGRPDSALLHFDQAIEAYTLAMDTLGLAGAWFEKSRALAMMRNRPASVAAGKRSIALRRGLNGDTTDLLARTMANVGMAYSEMGHPDSALHHLSQADSVMRARSAPAFDRALVQNSLSAVSLQLDDYARMLDHALVAQRLLGDTTTVFPPHVLPSNVQATAELNVCLALSGLGLLAEGRAHGERALALLGSVIAEAEGLHRNIALFNSYKAHNALYSICGQDEDAAGMRLHAEHGLEIARALFGPGQAEVAVSWSLLALACAEQGDLALAIAYADSSAQLLRDNQHDTAFRTNEYFHKMPPAIALHGLYRAMMGDAERAGVHFSEARAFMDDVHEGIPERDGLDMGMSVSELNRARSCFVEAKGYRILFDLQGDAAFMERSLATFDEAFEHLSALYASTDIWNRSSGGGLLWGAFSDAVDAALMANELEPLKPQAQRLVHYMEMARNAREERNHASLIASLPERSRDRIERLAQAERHLTRHRSVVGSSDPAAGPDSLAWYRNEVDSLRSAIRIDDPQVYRALYVKVVVPVDSLRRSLKPGEAMVSYMHATDALYILWLSADTVLAWKEVIPRQELDQLVSAFLSGLASTGTSREGRSAGERLAGMLLSRGLARAGVDRLIVVPDGPLWRLPFEALPLTEGPGRSDPLALVIERIHVHYASHMGAIHANRSMPSVTRPLQAFAFAPVQFSASPMYSGVDAGDHRPLALPMAMTELPGTEAEVRAWSKATRGKAFIQGSATKEQLRKVAAQCGVLHFATHALVDDVRPERSALIMWDDGRHDGAANAPGVLYASELADLGIGAELVVLSACATAAGRFQRGEGTLSLARAFHQAGARNVVSSLWRVEDQATQEIMTTFYELLTEGLGMGDALTEAKRRYARSHPEAPASQWAAFVLLGDNAPIKFKGMELPWATYIISLAILLISALGCYMVIRRYKVT